jgi:hypothetical protein
MQILSVELNGAVTVHMDATEARALRNVLERLPGSPAAHQLQRLLAMVHGDACPRCHCTRNCACDMTIPEQA